MVSRRWITDLVMPSWRYEAPVFFLLPRPSLEPLAAFAKYPDSIFPASRQWGEGGAAGQMDPLCGCTISLVYLLRSTPYIPCDTESACTLSP